MKNYWFVNLGQYKEQKDGRYLWAPLKNKNGKSNSYWESLLDVKIGDIIFCNNGGIIKAIGVATSEAYPAKIPDGLKKSWTDDGRKINVEFYELKENSIKYTDYKEYILKNMKSNEGPFDITGKAKSGYLFPLEEVIGKFFISKIKSIKLQDKIELGSSEIKDNIELELEESEQNKLINSGSVDKYTEKELQAIEDASYNYEEKIEKTPRTKREKTDPKLKMTRLSKAEFLCEIDNNHKTFLNSTNEHQYLECHHIIPMNAQKNYVNKRLDSLFNLIALCPVCHAKVHYASISQRKEIFEAMCNIRKEEMEKNGFGSDELEAIFDKYYSK